MAEITDNEAGYTFIRNRLLSSQIVENYVGRHPTSSVRQVYKKKAPEKATRPNIIVKFMAGNFPSSSQGRKRHAKMEFSIIINYEGLDDTDANLVLVEIEKLFQQSQMVDDPVLIGTSLTTQIDYDDLIEGVTVNHVGFQIQVRTHNQIQPYFS